MARQSNPFINWNI